MEQATFAELEHDSKRRRTRREIFLEKMDRLVPWEGLEKRIEPFYPRAGCGRRPYPLRTMLRVHCVQLFHDLSDPGMEDLLYEVESVRRFAGLRLTGPLPDETTILKFRHLLEKHGLGEGLFAEINAHLASLGHSARKGTIVDATIIEAPSSTKNAKRERDPEMHQAKKGNQWHFGMKAHIGVDAESGLAHSLETTAANVSDVATAHAVLHGDEEEVWGDAGYQGVGKRDENKDATVDWQTAMKPGKRRPAGQVGLGGGGGEAQGVDAGEGGAPVPVRQAALRLREGALPGSGEEPAADRAAAGFREPDDRGPLRDGLNAGPLRPFPAETAGNGAEGDEFAVSAAISATIGNTFRRGMDSRSRSACPTPYDVRKPGLIRPSLADSVRSTGPSMASPVDCGLLRISVSS